MNSLNEINRYVSNIPFLKKKTILEIQEIKDGKNNQNFKILTDKEILFLKICHTSKVQGINRKTEYLILEKAYHAGIGPKPIVFDPDTNIMIVEFLDLPVWTLKEIGMPTSLENFGKAIRKIHDLSPIHQSCHIEDLLDRYWDFLRDSLEIRMFKPFFESTREKLDAYNRADDVRFCHNDLCYGHFLKGETILFVDWETAGMNDLYSDLAAFIHFHRLDNQQTDLFLQSYSQTLLNRNKLIAHQDAILLRELLWAIAKLQEGHADPFYTDYRQRCLKAVMNKQDR